MRTEDIPEFRRLSHSMRMDWDEEMRAAVVWRAAIIWMTEKERIAEQVLGNRCTEVIVEDAQLTATQRQLEECQRELLSLKLALMGEGYVQ
jgi:hypothetical protein